MGPPSPLAPPWVSVPTRCSPLPPNHRFSAIRGERSGEGGHGLPNVESCVSLFFQHLLARSVTFANQRDLPPHPSPLPQHQKRVGGEGTNCGNADPGRHQRLLPRVPPWATIRRPADYAKSPVKLAILTQSVVVQNGRHHKILKDCHFAQLRGAL